MEKILKVGIVMLIIIAISVVFGLIAFAVFLYFGMQQAYIVLVGGFILMALMILWRFICGGFPFYKEGR